MDRWIETCPTLRTAPARPSYGREQICQQLWGVFPSAGIESAMTSAADKEQAVLKKKLELLLKKPENMVCADCPSRRAWPLLQVHALVSQDLCRPL